MDKFWIKSYPKGVPTEIDYTQYRSLAHLLEAVDPQVGPPVDFPGRPNAIVYLDFLEKENPELAAGPQAKRQAAK